MIYFVIILTTIIGISFVAWYANRQDNNPDTPVRPFLNGVSKANIKPIREEFLDNYMWACEVFGVRNNAYEQNYDHWLSDKQGDKLIRYFDYFVCYYVSRDSENYPKTIPKCKHHVDNTMDGFKTMGADGFMKEFNEIVLQYRKDSNTINEIKELGISPAEYLKPVNKHQPQPIDIQ